jgi:hypothetical protein
MSHLGAFMRTTSPLAFALSSLLVLAAGCAAPTAQSDGEPSADTEAPLSLPGGGCLVKHLTDALSLNRTRRPLYAAQTWGFSAVVSTALIDGESVSLVPAYVLDARAAALGRAGVPVLCEDLVPMAGAAPFATHTSVVGSFDASLAQAQVSAVEQAVTARSFDAAAKAADAAITTLESAPSFHCMTRHLLESIRRAATLAPGQSARAQAAGLSSQAESLAWSFIDLQSSDLTTAKWLDEAAAPFQAEGVGIICRDVPPIPAK